MRRFILCVLFCATGIESALVGPQNFDVDPLSRSQPRNETEPIRRFACPIGFFRLRRFCYYLSAGKAPWSEAYFHCRDRNATLAVLDGNGKDRMLRRYLMGDQFTKLERWIGGIFDWHRMAWEWGVIGEKMDFQSFAKPSYMDKSDRFAWHCLVVDPMEKYKWTPQLCTKPKHYICEVAAGRIARRRKKTTDPLAPQFQIMKPRKKGKKYNVERKKPNRRNRIRAKGRRDWAVQNTNQQWAHGVNLGSRPPSRLGRVMGRMHHHRNGTHPDKTNEVQIVQVSPQGDEYGAFSGDGHGYKPQNLAEMNGVLNHYRTKINDFAQEEVLLKP